MSRNKDFKNKDVAANLNFINGEYLYEKHAKLKIEHDWISEEALFEQFVDDEVKE